jgi:segregation and condensation protein B
MVSDKTINEIDDAKEKESLKILEAVFFVSGRFLNMQDLISLSDLNPIIIRGLIEKLKDKYDREDSALEIVYKGEKGSGMWKMDVRQEYAYIINKLATGNAEFTKAEQETLAIIAYKQPIKQSVIIKIRGNKSYDHIKKFSDLGLIKKKKMGHTNELSLSDEFYDYFNVADGEAKGKKIFEESGVSEEELNSDDDEVSGEEVVEEKKEVLEY